MTNNMNSDVNNMLKELSDSWNEFNKSFKKNQDINEERGLLEMLIEAIDYSFMRTDGTYDKSLTYPVIDKVNYIKKVKRYMDRAEEWALKEFPVEMGLEPNYDETPIEVDHNRFIRPLAEKCYRQAEKDLALTWEDIWEICTIVDKVKNEFCDNPSIFKLNEVTPDSFKKAYGEEVLRRFNEQRNK